LITKQKKKKILRLSLSIQLRQSKIYLHKRKQQKKNAEQFHTMSSV